MGRFTALFLFVGLVVGLWLGFNPATHRQLVRLWEHAGSRIHVAGVTTPLSTHRAERQANRFLRTSPQPQPALAPAQPNPVPSGPQISSELHAFWNALQRIWLDFVARLTGAKHGTGT